MGDHEHVFGTVTVVDERIDATHLPMIGDTRAEGHGTAWAAGAVPDSVLLVGWDVSIADDWQAQPV